MVVSPNLAPHSVWPSSFLSPGGPEHTSLPLRHHPATAARCSPKTSNSASKPVTGRACINGLPSRLTELQAEIEQLRAPLRLREDANSLAARRNRPPPTRPTRLPVSLPSEPPRPRGQQRGPGPVRHAGPTTVIYPLSLRNWNCRRTSNSVRTAANPSAPVSRHRMDSELLEIEVHVLTTAVVIVGTASIAPPAVAAAGQVLSSAHPLPPNRSSPKVNWECPSGSPCC